MKSDFRSFLWDVLPITEIFPAYYGKIHQILTEHPSC